MMIYLLMLGKKISLESSKQKNYSTRGRRSAVWLQSGDTNKTFFHNFANLRRDNNSIWELNDKNGFLLHYQKYLEKGVVKYFKYVYSNGENLNLLDQLKVIKNYPRIFSHEYGESISAVVTVNEVKEVPNQFTEDKSLGLECWIVEFFLHSFDMFGMELQGNLEYS